MPPMPAMPSHVDPETLDDLRGDCAHIDASWTTPGAPRPPARATVPDSPAPSTEIPEHGTRMVAGMTEYAD